MIGSMTGLMAFIAWRFHVAITGAFDYRIAELRSDIQALTSKLDSCQAQQKQCPLLYASKPDVSDLKREFMNLWEEIRKDRRESWARQEAVNMELFRSLNNHTHNGKTGQAIRGE